LHHITQTAFNEQLARSLALTTDFSNRVIDQFTIYTDRVDNLLYKYVQERLVYHLLSLAQRFGTKNSKGWHVIAAPISQQVIANSINASRENVSREFERLQRKGLVSFSNKLIAIPDLMSLAKVLPGETRLGL
jgi:CRP-like cAMP-binding protein